MTYIKYGRKRNYILSHKYKIAFVFIPKAGSSTIKRFTVKEANLPTSEYRKIYSNHCPDSYRCVCFVRNPFSRVYASFIHFTKKKGGRLNLKLEGFYEFNSFVKNVLEHINDKHFFSMKHFIDLASSNVTILRFENFSEEMKKLCGSNVPHKNKWSKLDYRQVYNNESIKIVSQLYKWDIDNLGYSF